MNEAEIQKQIQEQTNPFEKEALTAQKRIEEGRQLAALEIKKREQAETAKVRPEEEVRRLTVQINNFQKTSQEFQHHTDSGTSDSFNRNLSAENFRQAGNSAGNLSQQTPPVAQTTFDPAHGTVEVQARNSDENVKGFINTDSIPKRSIVLRVILASVFALLIAAALGGYGPYTLVINKPQTPEPVAANIPDTDYIYQLCNS